MPENPYLKRVPNMIRTYSQMHCADKYSQHSSIIWPAWVRSVIAGSSPVGVTQTVNLCETELYKKFYGYSF